MVEVPGRVVRVVPRVVRLLGAGRISRVVREGAARLLVRYAGLLDARASELRGLTARAIVASRVRSAARRVAGGTAPARR
jgi:hypothetical protein